MITPMQSDSPQDNNRFGERLKKLRHDAGLSQKELALRVGVDSSYLSKIERGKMPPPSGDTIVKICEAIGIPPEDMLADAGKMSSDLRDMFSNLPLLEFIRTAASNELKEEDWARLKDDVTPSTSKDDHAALILLCKGLVSLSNKGGNLKYPYPAELQASYNKLIRLYLEKGLSPPHSVIQLLDWCKNKPLIEWNLSIPLDGADHRERLLEDEEPGELCREWSLLETDNEGGLQKKVILSAMTIARERNDESLYEKFRRVLTEESIIDFKKRTELKLSPLSNLIDEAYEEISSLYLTGRNIHQCCRCHYLMTKTSEGGFACENYYCRKDYKPSYRELSGDPPFYIVRKDIHHYVTLPGFSELYLEKELKKYPNVTVKMWPQYDTYDLYLTFADGETWAVDVKDWHSPYALAKKLSERPFPMIPQWDRAFYVFPDRRRKERPDYRRCFVKYWRALNKKNIGIEWEDDFLKLVGEKTNA